MDHSYFKERVSAYHDAGLNLEEQELMRQHIAECEQCRAALAELEAFDRMVEERSTLKADDYFEENAQKIEAALGFGSSEKVTDITPPKRSGLWWKVSAVVATAAVLAFIAIHEEDIGEPPMPSRQETPTLKNDGIRLPESERPEPDKTAGSAKEESRQDRDVANDEFVPKSMDEKAIAVPPPSPQVAPQRTTTEKQEPILQDLGPSDISQSIEVKPEVSKTGLADKSVEFNSVGESIVAPAVPTGELIGTRTVLGGGRESDSAQLANYRESVASLSKRRATTLQKPTASSD